MDLSKLSEFSSTDSTASRKTDISNNLWLVPLKPNPSARFRLFCFPHAGGGVPVFAKWPDGLPRDVEVNVVQLPGRGARIREAPFTRLAPLIESLTLAIQDRFDKPFAFFGHSLGALAAFELARELRRRRLPPPAQLFVSGRRAPHLPDADLPIHALPDSHFIAELRKMNGTPAEVLDNKEVMQLLLPVLRADFALGETTVYSPEPPLDCPLSAWGGLQDVRVSRDALEAWRQHTTGAFSLRMFPGDHFFAFTAARPVLEAIAAELN